MIDFSLTDEQKLIQQETRKFVEREIKPVAQKLDVEGDLNKYFEILKKMRELGLSSLGTQKIFDEEGKLKLTELKKTPFDSVTTVLVLEELAAGCLGVATAICATWLGILPIILSFNLKLWQKYLPDFLSNLGNEVRLGAFAITEPGCGSDIEARSLFPYANISTMAEKKGERYILNGTKCFISNGGLAHLYTVLATTDRKDAAKGSCMFVVEADTPGLKIGKIEDKMGIRISQTAEIIFEDVEVPEENLLGPIGKGFDLSLQTLYFSRPGVGAFAVGVARSAYEEALRYARERIQGGKRLIEHQAIGFMLADMATYIDAARFLVWRAAWLANKSALTSVESAMAKFFPSDVAMKVTTDAVQILGGYGYMKDFPVEKYMRDAKITQIYEGTNQIQRLNIVEELMK